MTDGIRVSFEVFPPGEAGAVARLRQAVIRMGEFGPAFVSVTYGAGGSARGRSMRTVRALNSGAGVEIAAHVTCAGAPKTEIDRMASAWRDLGIRRIVALRGDAPEGQQRFEPHPGGYPDSISLISGLRSIAPFEILVGAYPEAHPESLSPGADLDHLKRKFDAGASAAITQYFFEPGTFLRFRDRARAAGIDRPIIPGILPVVNFAKVVEFSRRCGASVPRWMHEQFAHLDAGSTVGGHVAAANACGLCRELRREGVDAFHIYTMNRLELPSAICHCLGLTPDVRRSA